MSTNLSHDPQDLLTGELHGAPVARPPVIHHRYSSIIGFHSRWFTDLDIALNSPSPPEAASVPSACDDAGALLRMSGFRIRQAALSPESTKTARVVVAGCSRALPDYLPDGFFERGGILVSSDRTILDVPQVADVLECRDPGPAREVLLHVHDARKKVVQRVFLPAGHVPVRSVTTDRRQIRIIASDHATGEPIVLAVRIGNGWLLHSVAHWYQDAGISGGPEVLTGAIRSMSLALLAGLEHVLTAPAEIRCR